MSIPSAPVSLAAPRVAALVGEFPRSPAFRGLADGPPHADRRGPGPGRRPAAERARPHRGGRCQPHHRDACVRRAPRRGLPREPAGVRQRHPAAGVARRAHRPPADGARPARAGPDRPHDRHPAGASGHGRRVRARRSSGSRRTCPAPATTPQECPRCARRSPGRYAARGLPTDPEQLIVVAGALAGVALAAQVLSRPGERVLVESPTYPNPITTLRARRARLVTTPVDPAHGWDVAHALRVARGTRMAYLIPDFHNPTGRVDAGGPAAGAGRRARPARRGAGGGRVAGRPVPRRPAASRPVRLVRARGVQRGQRLQGLLGRSAHRVDPGAPSPGRGGDGRAAQPRPRLTAPGAAGPPRDARRRGVRASPSPHHHRARRATRWPVRSPRRCPTGSSRQVAAGCRCGAGCPRRAPPTSRSRPSRRAFTSPPDRRSPPTAGWSTGSGSRTPSRPR